MGVTIECNLYVWTHDFAIVEELSSWSHHRVLPLLLILAYAMRVVLCSQLWAVNGHPFSQL